MLLSRLLTSSSALFVLLSRLSQLGLKVLEADNIKHCPRYRMTPRFVREVNNDSRRDGEASFEACTMSDQWGCAHSVLIRGH
ncbi:uncharacterized protein B0H64DRAFT_402426 [Chaetomium fimeti]|uniref:Secreted protein n=1 Tax=Chaetomium fimeti TaxID=1854472 RepID=A0AAE0HEW7_9PEZI|nr:hypothetical protein B0H64DRAFT_402426 [Chaetomium fimeti]